MNCLIPTPRISIRDKSGSLEVDLCKEVAVDLPPLSHTRHDFIPPSLKLRLRAILLCFRFALLPE